jgi:hypothetical protein
MRHAEVAADVLGAVGHPMQLKDLLAAMVDRGAVVAGKNDQQRRSNLIITLSRSALVERVERGVYALTKRRQPASKQTPRETGGNSARSRASRRKAAEFTVPIKLWVSQEMYDKLDDIAHEQEWSVPQVIRWFVRRAQRKHEL